MKGQMKAWYNELHLMRVPPGQDAIGQQISFREFLATKGKAPNGDGNLEPEHVYESLGLPFNATLGQLCATEDGFYVACELVREAFERGLYGATVRQQASAEKLLKAVYSQAIITTDPASRYITPEYFTPAIARGVVQSAYWDALIAQDINVPQPKIDFPLLSLSDANLKKVGQAGTIQEGTVSYGSKTVVIEKRGRGIYFTDESLMFNTPIDLVMIFIEDMGLEIGSGLNGEAVRVLRDGDQSNGSEAATVIGSENGSTFDYDNDILRIMIRMGMINRAVSQVIAGETEARKWEALPEVKNHQQYGTAIMPSRTRGITRPPEWEVFPAFNVPANKLIFSNPLMAMVALTAKQLTLEQDRIVNRQLNGVFATIWKGFAIKQKNGRVILNKAVAFSGNGWTSDFDGNQENW
jgi:hypothetical protein